MNRAQSASTALRCSARCNGSGFKSTWRGALYAVLLPALAAVANAVAGTAAPPVPEAGARAQAAGRSTAPVVDAHMHVWSDQPDRYPFAHPFEPKFKPPRIAATVELLVEEMDRSGVTQCVLVQTIYHGWDNRYLAQCLKAHPQRFRGQGLSTRPTPRPPSSWSSGSRSTGCLGCDLARCTTGARTAG